MSEHTAGPWVGFSDQGKVVAIMPAGREGDICTFNQSPSEADARLITAAPKLAEALQLAEAVLNEVALKMGGHLECLAPIRRALAVAGVGYLVPSVIKEQQDASR